MISKRALSIDSSGVRKVFDLAAKIKNPINLSIGQPDFEPSFAVREATKLAIDSKRSGYTVTQGINDLRVKIAAEYGIKIDDSTSDLEVVVTSGVSGGIMNAMLAMLDPGDEILIPDPFFCIYRDLAVLINAVPKYYDTYPDFKLCATSIEKEITPRTKAILVNSPSNPTGYAVTQEELNEVIELARSRNLWLIYDEIYSKFCYDRPHAECLRNYENILLLNGFSKSHGVPGWRLGYAIGTKNLISQMLKIQQYTFVCAPSIAQVGIAAGVGEPFEEHLSDYIKKRDFIYEALKGKYEVIKPGGAFYLFPQAPGGDASKFVERCIAKDLLVVPGNVFSRKDTHFRISFSASMETLQRGVDVLLGLRV